MCSTETVQWSQTAWEGGTGGGGGGGEEIDGYPDQINRLVPGIFLGNIFKNDHRDNFGGAILAQQGGFLTIPCLL